LTGYIDFFDRLPLEILYRFDSIKKLMINEDKKNPQQDQNVKSVQYENTPENVIFNAARFNKQFLDSQLQRQPCYCKYRQDVDCIE
jgi:hypothetical protein